MMYRFEYEKPHLHYISEHHQHPSHVVWRKDELVFQVGSDDRAVVIASDTLQRRTVTFEGKQYFARPLELYRYIDITILSRAKAA